MTDLDVLLEEYLATRRALGTRLVLSGRLLQRFVTFAMEHGDTAITRTRALEWATAPREVQPAQWANRLGMVCRFSRYASAVDPRHEIVPQGLLPYQYRRREPYIYSDAEIADLIGAARRLPGRTGLRPLTFATLLGLLAVTGMRTNEILNLDRDDADLAQGVLTIRNGKFGKSRHVMVHATTVRALERYAERRDRLCATPRCPAFFVSEHGTRITEWTLRHTFVNLSRQTGLRVPARSHGKGPRLLDFRHAFAVRTLLRWHHDGVDVEQHVPRLATWLGHAHVGDTYWYLTATPELMQQAARRLDRTGRGVPS